MSRLGLIARLLAAATPLVAQPAGSPRPPTMYEKALLGPESPYPAKGTLSEIAAWLDKEYTRRAVIAQPPPTGSGTCWQISVSVRADAIPREEWARLSERCRGSIEYGPVADKVMALKFAAWHLQQAAGDDETLAELYDPGLIGAIAGALASENAEVRKAAVGAARAGPRLAADPLCVVLPLLVRLRDDDPVIRRAAAGSLWGLSSAGHGLGRHGAAATTALVAALHDKDKQVRSEVRLALGAAGEAGRAAVPALVEVARSGERPDRLMAMFALENLGPVAEGAVGALIEFTRDPDARVRWRATSTLGRLGPAAVVAVPDLIRLLDDEDEFVRSGAARSLGELGPAASAALPKLWAAASRDPEAYGGWAQASVNKILGRDP